MCRNMLAKYGCRCCSQEGPIFFRWVQASTNWDKTTSTIGQCCEKSARRSSSRTGRCFSIPQPHRSRIEAAASLPPHRGQLTEAAQPHSCTAAPHAPPQRITAAAPRRTALPQHHCTSTASPPHLGRPSGGTATAPPHGCRTIAQPCSIAAASPQLYHPLDHRTSAESSPHSLRTLRQAAQPQHHRRIASPPHLCPSRRTHSAAPQVAAAAAPVVQRRPVRRTAPHRRSTASLQHLNIAAVSLLQHRRRTTASQQHRRSTICTHYSQTSRSGAAAQPHRKRSRDIISGPF
jgi:hypothetical protein